MRFAVTRAFIIVAAFALTSLPLATPAQAAPAIDAAGAATLKTVVDDALGFYLDMQKKTGEGLTLSGPVEVVPKGSYYEVKIPGAAMVSETATMTIGTVMVNATPEDDGDYRASIAVPRQMVMKDTAGDERMVIDLGSQKFSGVFTPALGLFSKAEASYDNVTATITPKSEQPPADGNESTKESAKSSKAEPVTITLGSVSSALNMQRDGDLWSGPQTTTIRNAALAFGDGKASKLTIGELIAAVSYNKIDLGAGKKLRDQLRQSLQENGNLSLETLQKTISTTMGGMVGMPESGTSAFTLSDLTLDIPPAPGAANAHPFSLRLARVASNSTMAGMKGDDGTLTSKSTLTGMSMTGFSGPLAGIVPSEAAVNITAAKVPFKSIMNTLGAAVNDVMATQTAADGTSNTSAAADAQAKQQAQEALAALPALLAQAGTTVTVNDTYVTSPDLNSKLDGVLTAVSGAPYIFAGKTTLVLAGMDELIAKLQQQSQTANDPRAAGYAQMLIIMQLSGQLSKTPDGKSQRTYALELTPDGNVKLNGADMKALIPAADAKPATP